MSGGIDSSTTVYLLQQQGYEVSGVYLKLHDKEASHEFYIKRATEVSERLGIDFKVVEFQEEFKEKVYDYFVQSYIDGITPNPCAMCNREVKFGLLMRYALDNGFEYFATGHYVRTDGQFLYEGKDNSKDQSYFLFYIKPEYIKHILFPLGDMDKADVIKLATEKDLFSKISEYKESQEICFVDDTYMQILERHTNPNKAGKVVDLEGNEVGEHKGYMHYTIGKRKGFTVRGAHDPHYVMGIDSKTNTLTVGKKGARMSKEIFIKDVNLFEEKEDFSCSVKVRYRSRPYPCSVKLLDDNKAQIILDNEIDAVAPGQAAVFYENDKVLGGGWIEA